MIDFEYGVISREANHPGTFFSFIFLKNMASFYFIQHRVSCPKVTWEFAKSSGQRTGVQYAREVQMKREAS